jgi:hypothetical protein
MDRMSIGRGLDHRAVLPIPAPALPHPNRAAGMSRTKLKMGSIDPLRGMRHQKSRDTRHHRRKAVQVPSSQKNMDARAPKSAVLVSVSFTHVFVGRSA